MKKRAKKEAKKNQDCCNTETCSCKSNCGACGGGIYGLGFIGALVYYISQANGFWVGVLGFLKALVWPAFLVYNALKFMGI